MRRIQPKNRQLCCLGYLKELYNKPREAELVEELSDDADGKRKGMRIEKIGRLKLDGFGYNEKFVKS